MTEYHFEEKKAGEKYEDEGSGKKQMPRACKLLRWWNKRWPASGDLQSRVKMKKIKGSR